METKHTRAMEHNVHGDYQPLGPPARVDALKSEAMAMEHGGHGGMAHDMSDPQMAAAMEADIRRRFFVALLLTIPTVLYSPLFTRFFGLELPAPIPHNGIMFLFTTPV